MLRRLLALLAFAAAAYAALLAYRSRGGGHVRVDVHFDDGSFVSYGPRSSEAQRLLPLAREALTAVRT